MSQTAHYTILGPIDAEIIFVSTKKSILFVRMEIKTPMKKSESNKLDKLWREKVKERDEHKCRVCGSTSYVNAHHVVGRRNHQVRWILDNGIALCSGCHTFKTRSAHQDPQWFINWWESTYPERTKKVSELKNRLDKPDYDKLLEYLTFL